jgi:hypothetical protein
MRRAAKLLLVTVAAMVATPAYSQGPDLKDLLSGRNIPLTLKLKDLNADWRRVSIGGAESGGYSQLLTGMLGSLLGGAGGGGYYTKGDTVALGGETYLIAYRTHVKEIDFTALMRGGGDAGPPKPEPLTPDTPLTLSLLNLRSVGSISDIRPFNLEQEVAGTAREQDGQASSARNLKQLGLGLQMYRQDYDEMFPPMPDAATLKPLIMPYLKNEAVFVHPETKEPYQPNKTLSRRPESSIEKPAETVAMFEASPDAQGGRTTLFIDGHVKWLKEESFQEALKSSLLPPLPPKAAPRKPPAVKRSPARRPSTRSKTPLRRH